MMEYNKLFDIFMLSSHFAANRLSRFFRGHYAQLESFKQHNAHLSLMTCCVSNYMRNAFLISSEMKITLIRRLLSLVFKKDHYRLTFSNAMCVISRTHKFEKPSCEATLTGHISAVMSVAFHPTAPLLATASCDNTAKLWRMSSDGSSPTCVEILAKHTSSVTCVAFSPSGALLATCSDDNTAKLWRLSSNNSSATYAATLQGHSSNVTSVAFHSSLPLLGTSSYDNAARLWRFSPDGSSVFCVSILAGHSRPVNSFMFHASLPLLATGSMDKTAKLWSFSPDGSSATCEATLTEHSDWVNSVAFHPTAPLLATGSSDNTAKLWSFSHDGSSATCVATLGGAQQRCFLCRLQSNHVHSGNRQLGQDREVVAPILRQLVSDLCGDFGGAQK